MKHLLLLSIVLLTAIGCEKKGQILDPNAMVSIRPEQGVKSTTKQTNPNHLTALEIVKEADEMVLWNYDIDTTNHYGQSFTDIQRDTANVKLLMWGTNIIEADGRYIPDFIEGEDLVLRRWYGGVSQMKNVDTIGYVKNTTLRSAEIQIKEAYDREDYTTVYEVFDEAFTFLPITGEEWRELKAKGIN